jgi:hypothetical protein
MSGTRIPRHTLSASGVVARNQRHLICMFNIHHRSKPARSVQQLGRGGAEITCRAGGQLGIFACYSSGEMPGPSEAGLTWNEHWGKALSR